MVLSLPQAMIRATPASVAERRAVFFQDMLMLEGVVRVEHGRFHMHTFATTLMLTVFDAASTCSSWDDAHPHVVDSPPLVLT